MNRSNRTFEEGIYICPSCKNALKVEKDAFNCLVCHTSYPIVDCIPDFILEDLSKSNNRALRWVRSIDWLSRVYESQWWYPLVLSIFGGWDSTSLEQLREIVANNLERVTGRIVDVACGPGTFSRRLASSSKEVFGMDISMGMLHQGTALAERENVDNIHFSRAKVEALPYRDNFFDAGICCGALHLFEDKVAALKEINRVLKQGALLAAFTFFAGDKGVLRFHRIREHVGKDHGVHVFKISEIEENLKKAGFEKFKPETFGSILAFSAVKVAGVAGIELD